MGFTAFFLLYEEGSLSAIFHFSFMLCKNALTRDRAIAEIAADVNDAISNPGTRIAEYHKSATLMRNAKIPKVKMEIGRAII